LTKWKKESWCKTTVHPHPPPKRTKKKNGLCLSGGCGLCYEEEKGCQILFVEEERVWVYVEEEGVHG